MDIASIVGLVVCFVLLVYSIIMGAGLSGLVNSFVDLNSVLITFGGSFFTVMASVSMEDYIGGLKSWGEIYQELVGEENPALDKMKIQKKGWISFFK